MNTQLSSETAQLHAEFIDTEKEVKKLEQKWQELKLEYDRSEMLLEKAKLESDENAQGRRRSDEKPTTLRETLSMQLREQENVYGKLKNVRKVFKFLDRSLTSFNFFKERDHLQSSKENRRKQIEMWTDLSELFDLKKKCFLAAKHQGIGGTLSFTNTSETFTLQ